MPPPCLSLPSSTLWAFLGSRAPGRAELQGGCTPPGWLAWLAYPPARGPVWSAPHRCHWQGRSLPLHLPPIREAAASISSAAGACHLSEDSCQHLVQLPPQDAVTRRPAVQAQSEHRCFNDNKLLASSEMNPSHRCLSSFRQSYRTIALVIMLNWRLLQ